MTQNHAINMLLLPSNNTMLVTMTTQPVSCHGSLSNTTRLLMLPKSCSHFKIQSDYFCPDHNALMHTNTRYHMTLTSYDPNFLVT